MLVTHMTLKVLLPYKIFAEKPNVFRVIAETTDGSFGILPNRRDCVAALSPGILTYEFESDGEVYLAIDEGVLIKTGQLLLISVRNAIAGDDLNHLRDAVKSEFLALNDEQRDIRSVMTKIESGFIRRMVEFTHA